MNRILLSVLSATALAGSLAVAQPDDGFSLSQIDLPPGFAIEWVSQDLPGARSLAAGDGGVVFVSTRGQGKVYALVPGADGFTVKTLLSSMSVPNGIAYRAGDLYVAEVGRILKYKSVMPRLDDLPEPEVISSELPTARLHGWRYIGFGPDDMLYVSIGAPCNVCDQPKYATIARLAPEGGPLRQFALGVRNSVGFTWHPDTGQLWFTDNGRDWLGDELPPGELNVAVDPGQHFGFPFCHGGDLKDPDLGRLGNCADSVPPVSKLGPHVAPLGVKFYTGEAFPERFRNQVFIAEHGSWNRSEKIGYRVTLVTLDGDRALSYAPFATGWLTNGKVFGRPVDLLVRDDGSLWVSDDYRGAVYRIYFDKELEQ